MNKMATKLKVFKMDEENSEGITKFLETVNVTQDGFMIGSGMLGILYREKDNLGMERDQLAVAISGELSKSQKQFVLQEGLCRAYSAMIDLYSKREAEKKAIFEAKEKELAEYNTKWDGKLEQEVNDAKSKLGAMEKKYKSAGKLDKAELEKQTFALSQELKPLEEKLAAHKKEFDAGKYTLELSLGEVKLEYANLGGLIKENKGLLETAELDREHAKVFIVSTQKLIEDIQNGEVIDAEVKGLAK